MKLIDKWKDKDYKATNYLYEFPNGFRLVVSVKPDIKDFNADLVMLAGSYFEKQAQVPQGTAHFLEHMLLNPNEKFKTKKDLDLFKFGTRTKPEIFTNGAIWHKQVAYYGFTKLKSAKKLLQFLKLTVNYPTKRFNEFIEKEKGVILAELQGYKKEDSDPNLAYDRFFYGDEYPEFTNRVLGTEESLKSLTVDDLIKYWNFVRNPKNTVLAIQTSKKLSKELIKEIKDIVNLKVWDSNVKLKINRTSVENQLKYKHFHDVQEQGVFMSVNFFVPVKKNDQNYESVLNYISKNLINYVAFNLLREELGIAYSVNSFSVITVWNNKLKGYTVNLEKNNLGKVLDAMYDVLFNRLNAFLDSSEGQKWFESKISNYIFVSTPNYDGDYARDIAMDIIRDEVDYKYDFFKSVEIAKKITADEVKKYIQKNFLDIPGGYWFVSPYEDEEIYSIFKKSKFYKHYKK